MSEKNVKTALVIGASRGLGLGLACEFLERGWEVTATVRTAPKHDEFKAHHGRVRLDTLDINRPKMVDDFLARIHDQIFDVVFINAGVSGPSGKDALIATPDEITHLFMSNAISPISLGTRLLPNVKPGTGILVFMTSILGSVTRGAGDYAPLYSASKSALNQLTRSFVAAMKEEITVISMHPGWVRTDMGGQGADIDVATSVRGMVDVLEAKAGSHKHEYLDYLGATIPW
jgi:NAD(P)-dependent dehydrogenase (short-subunit alcohol dehydrogenase family)